MATENSILSHLRQRLIWTQCEIESLCEAFHFHPTRRSEITKALKLARKERHEIKQVLSRKCTKA